MAGSQGYLVNPAALEKKIKLAGIGEENGMVTMDGDGSLMCILVHKHRKIFYHFLGPCALSCFKTLVENI